MSDTRQFGIQRYLDHEAIRNAAFDLLEASIEEAQVAVLKELEAQGFEPGGPSQVTVIVRVEQRAERKA